MSSTVQYAPPTELDVEQDTLDRVLALTEGENPVPFITMSEPHTALALIRGINDLERLAGWRLANELFLDPPRRQVTEALDEREAELTGTEPETVPAPNPEPEPEPESKPDRSRIHPESKIERSEAIAIERGQRTEFIIPNRSRAELPYTSQTFDEDANPATDPVEMSNDDLLRRVSGDHERVPIEDVPGALEVHR